CEKALRKTDSGHAPWHLIEATDERYRDITVGQILLESMQNKLKEVEQSKKKRKKKTVKKEHAQPISQKTVLDTVKLDQK
ncbi:MAG: polyphosphate:AMP phosphotransferase, partial [Candidatus Dadabacteria bacterium]|nr:polyphosphate:AMP phosphotransferase [Candidatus Dadabacteria bacterium]